MEDKEENTFYAKEVSPRKLLASESGGMAIWEEVFPDGTIHTFGSIGDIRYMLVGGSWCQTTPEFEEFAGKLICTATPSPNVIDLTGDWFDCLHSKWKQKFYGRNFDKDEI